MFPMKINSQDATLSTRGRILGYAVTAAEVAFNNK